MATLSTHVLDTHVGRPATGLRVSLLTDAGNELGDGVTDADGRIPEIGPERLGDGDYTLVFDTGTYFRQTRVTGFYPQVVVHFSVEGDEHFHVPLLLNPYGYSTYRGS